MKQILTFLLALCWLSASADKATYEKLCEVNKCWKEQSNTAPLPGYTNHSETQWIQLHLQLVEQTLRNRDVSTLTTSQKINRNEALNHLHQYWMAGSFPQNEHYNYRTPIFIDEHDNFCAVGYLVKATGHENVSRMIAANTNLAYVKQMHYPELNNWAKQYGFTTEELAWIQPGYPPRCAGKNIGTGTNGEVLELYADDVTDKLYVGGNFSLVDGKQGSSLATIVEESGTFKINPAASVNGPVYAIARYDNKLFIGGSFTMVDNVPANNIAYMENGVWKDAGCIYGTVKDLVVYNGSLYACGDFDVCAALSDVNFAKWDGSIWTSMGSLPGHINTLEVWNNKLVLGGDFSFGNDHVNALMWDENGYHQFDNAIPNEVMDFQAFKGQLYASCKFTTPAHTSELLQKLSGNSWVVEPTGILAMAQGTSLNSLCVDNDTFAVAGKFQSGLIVGTYAYNYYTLLNTSPDGWPVVNDEINKLAFYHGKVFMGGKFTQDMNTQAQLNSIAYKESLYGTAVKSIDGNNNLHIYPNPTANTLNIDGLKGNTGYNIYNMQGQKVKAGETQKQIDVQPLPAGNYMLQMSNNDGSTNAQFIKQ
jgi:hypothetical protein